MVAQAPDDLATFPAVTREEEGALVAERQDGQVPAVKNVWK